MARGISLHELEDPTEHKVRLIEWHVILDYSAREQLVQRDSEDSDRIRTVLLAGSVRAIVRRLLDALIFLDAQCQTCVRSPKSLPP